MRLSMMVFLNIRNQFTTNSGITGTGTLNFSNNTDERFTNGASIVQDTININFGNYRKLILDKGSTIQGNINIQQGDLDIYADGLLSDVILTSGSNGRVTLRDGTLTSAITSQIQNIGYISMVMLPFKTLFQQVV